MRSDAEEVSLCTFMVGEEMFAIDTKKISEVLEVRTICRIPLAPAYVAGVIPNRGEVLTTVSLRALLGLEERANASAVVVLEDADEQFGLMVDAVSNVLTLRAGALEANPSTLGARSKALFDGAYKLPEGLVVRLDTAKLRPARLKGNELFTNEVMRRKAGKKELECEH